MSDTITQDYDAATEKLICTDIVECYLLDNYPHIYNTTTRSGIKIWVEKYLESKK